MTSATSWNWVVSWHILTQNTNTLPETNIAPAKWMVVRWNSFRDGIFSGSMLVFRESKSNTNSCRNFNKNSSAEIRPQKQFGRLPKCRKRSTPTMVLGRLANEYPETCTWKQREIPCSPKGIFGEPCCFVSGEVTWRLFCQPGWKLLYQKIPHRQT